MKVINIRKVCRSGTVTRDDGQIIYDLLVELWTKEDRVVLDFKGLVIASVSFLDEALGKLAFDHTKEEIREKLGVRNMDDRDRALLNDIFISRRKQKDAEKLPPRKKKPSRKRSGR